MAYEVYITEGFEQETFNITGKERERIKKIFKQLRDNPYVGDTIRYRFFREKRIKEKRIYYLVYDDLKVVLVVAFGKKKSQQKQIDEIIKSFKDYRKYAVKLFGS